ncbi:MAG TPA: ubiquinol-cytochrome c reductase iron-sulfur subunit [Thermodesulfovibrionia bacterium]|nr:ubiquinol-cytochrome c reductase iron-sulfur subunit [Thermodesulfovibrionia bacterium]
MERREFLVKFIKWTFALFGLGTAATGIFFYPPAIRQRPVRFFPVLEVERRPKRGVKVVTFTYDRKGKQFETKAFLIAKEHNLTALSPVCTHLGCMVRWDRVDETFKCPCHGGIYDSLGRVKAGPPPAPLTELPVKIVDGMIYIGLKV